MLINGFEVFILLEANSGQENITSLLSTHEEFTGSKSI
jgi:hypothetical protein